MNENGSKNYRPYVMIDMEKSEISSCIMIGWDYLICKFHLFSRFKLQAGLRIEDEIKRKEAIHILYKMYGTRNDEQFFDLKSELENTLGKQSSFLSYFEQNYVENRKNWTRIMRFEKCVYKHYKKQTYINR